MSDHTGDLEADVPPPPGSDDLIPETAAPAPHRGAGATVALAAGILVVLAGAAFAAVSLAGGDGGTPESAVERLLDAAEDEDVLGALEALAPGERAAYLDDLPDVIDELNRLQILDGADLAKIEGVDLEFDDVKLATKQVRDDLADVRIVSGRSTAMVNPARLPLGDFVRDIAGDGLREAKPSTTRGKLADDDTSITTIKVDGRWYVSIWYSVAESGRRDSGGRVPAKGSGVRPRGARTAEVAVEQLLQASASLDVRRMIELLPPDEAAALHEYAGLFIDDAEREIRGASDAFDLTISKLDLSSTSAGDRSVVKIRSAELAFKGGGVSVTYKGGCADIELPDEAPSGDDISLTPRFNFESGRYCKDDLEKLQRQLGGAGLFGAPFGFGGLGAGQLGTRRADIGFVVVRRDGAWFVSPTRTLLGGLAGTLKSLDRKDLDKLAEGIGGYIEMFAGTGSETAFGEESFNGTFTSAPPGVKQARVPPDYQAPGYAP